MKVLIVAVGKIRGAEADMTADYLTRANAGSGKLGLSFQLIEAPSPNPVDPRKETAGVLKATPDDCVKVLLDERGQDLGSRQIAEKITGWRDSGRPAVAFWVGGADGASQTLKDQSDLKLAFGRATWPHRLVRAMLAEQLYRVSTILGHTPYHRD